jgi:Tfp pilus assembly protein PilF
MSLLMEALKRAEQAKRQAERSTTTEGQSGGAGPQDGQTTHLELLEEDLAGIADPRPAPARAATPRAESGPATAAPADGGARQRQAAQNVFTAKQPAERSSFPMLVGIGSLLAITGIAAYFWWQLQPRNPGLAPAPDAVPVAAPQAAVSPPASPPPSAPATAREHSPVPVMSSLAAAPAASDSRARPKAPPSSSPATVSPRAPAGEPGGAEKARPSTETRVPIRVSRGGRQVDPDLAAGYRRFQAGDLSGARKSYEQALRNDPRSVDALNGLAAISAREGGSVEAQQYYLRALEADPQDATAQSALTLLGESGDPVQTESRLKLLLARQPDAHAARFALGNLYASQRQWHEAQQAYFDAHTAEPENPDYLFNLAVSLDQLNQPRLALEFYGKALAAASGRPAAFPRDQAESRVRELGVQ